MEFTWENFKNSYKTEQEARQGFVSFCDSLMEKLYPDFSLKNSDEISENENKKDRSLGKKCIVYLPKYFLDSVSNSRKGQIRKSLNDNLPYMKANKITQWVLLLPHVFSLDEESWWENWSLRIKQENGITPTVKLGNELIQLSEKFNLSPFGNETPKEEESNETDDDLIDFSFDYSTEESQEETLETQEEKTLEVSQEEKTESQEEKPLEEPVSEENSEAATAAKIVETTISQAMISKKVSAKKTHEPTLEELASTYDFKTKFEALEAEKLELPDKKGNNQRAVFDKRRDESSVKNYLNDFVFGDLSQFTGKDLIKKAQIYVNNEQYSRGLYIYEYAKQKDLVDSSLATEYRKGATESRFQLNYKYAMIKGDLLFAKRDFINAAETYKSACEVIDSYRETLEEYESDMSVTTTSTSLMRNNEAIVKYYEAYGEALLQVGDFTGALEKFTLALDHDPSNRNIQDRYDLAEYLEKGSNFFSNKWLSWLNIFIAPFYYFKARKIDPSIKELEKAEKLRRKAIWGLVVIFLLLAGVFVLFYLGKKLADSTVQSTNGGISVNTASTPLKLQISKGDYYMDKISPENPHFIDSAIAAYQRALRIDNTDTNAENGYQKACIARANYLTQVQQHISTDSASYFLSMRRPTEGLRLFKYMYDPEDKTKGKFGFVDTLGNVIIAPMFDFNYKNMNEQGETFYNGKAKVCLKVADNDTVYFYIDQRGNKIEDF